MEKLSATYLLSLTFDFSTLYTTGPYNKFSISAFLGLFDTCHSCNRKKMLEMSSKQNSISPFIRSNVSIRQFKVKQPIIYFHCSPFSVWEGSLGNAICLDIAPFYDNYFIPCL